jgi:AraC-like DNA-binding protein
VSRDFASVQYGNEVLACGTHLPRHRHLQPYAAVVLAGSYVEAGDAGRWRVTAANVLTHRCFDSHCDQIGLSGARLLNLPLLASFASIPAFRISDPDRLAVLAEKSVETAAEALVEQDRHGLPEMEDWPDLLARDLRTCREFRLQEWSRAHGLAGSTISRGFQLAYGVTPIRYRLEARTKRALRMIRTESESLAAIACLCGFADQAHMTRSVSSLTGLPPSEWKRVK